MPSLREVQRGFAAALLSEAAPRIARHVVGGGFTARERIAIYRNSARSTLAAALELTYPAVARLVGTDFFDHAASRFVHEEPPAGSHLNEYGAGFADFLARFPGAAGIRYLPDVARFEWALQESANAPDAPATTAGDLAALGDGSLRFTPHPSLRMLELRHPADAIADAVLAGNETAMRAIDLDAGPVRIVVHRGPSGVETERLDAADHDFLAALFAGEAWDELAARSPDRAADLLATQLVKGRLGGFRIQDEPEEP